MRKLSVWNKQKITKVEDIVEMVRVFKKARAEEFFIDTETTGLHILNDKPFLLQIGFINKEQNAGNVYLVRDIELIKQTLLAAFKLSHIYIGHNIKFDIHMLMNLGIKFPDNAFFKDTQVYIRGAHDALTTANGGPPLGLKEYTTRYIDRSAKDLERLLKLEQKEIAKEYNVQLKNTLYKLDKRWTLAGIDSYFKDVLNSIDTLPDVIKTAYLEWLSKVPNEIKAKMTTGKINSEDIPYSLLNQDNLEAYAYYDIIYTAEIYLVCSAAIDARKNNTFLYSELELIPALIRMERCGFEMNKEYIKTATKEMADYLKQQREELTKLVGSEISVGQHALIKDILCNRYKLEVAGSGKEDLSRVYDELKHKKPDEEVTKFIGLVQELRTLEKWYSTYLLRFIKEMELGDRIYTQINQVGTVSGRVTSDFQQFPRFGITKEDGTSLFNPRNMIKVTPGFKGLAYLDYSQIELRVQAMYTILVGAPDLNLCRAYMPYECYKLVDGVKETYDYTNKKHLETAYTAEWFHLEDDAPWHPVDVHAATTSIAFPDVDPASDEFKKLRGQVGKRVNFAKNYGAQFNRIKQMFPEYDDETIKVIDEAYYKAFPGIKAYHSYCYDIVGRQTGITNLFGIKYYGLSGHKLINTLIQGSSAYFLKNRIYEIDKYIQKNKLKTRLQMQIHDELSYELYPGEEKHIEEFRKIMQTWENTLVPIVADLEFSTTTWANKEEVDKIV